MPDPFSAIASHMLEVLSPAEDQAAQVPAKPLRASSIKAADTAIEVAKDVANDAKRLGFLPFPAGPVAMRQPRADDLPAVLNMVLDQCAATGLLALGSMWCADDDQSDVDGRLGLAATRLARHAAEEFDGFRRASVRSGSSADRAEKADAQGQSVFSWLQAMLEMARSCVPESAASLELHLEQAARALRERIVVQRRNEREREDDFARKHHHLPASADGKPPTLKPQQDTIAAFRHEEHLSEQARARLLPKIEDSHKAAVRAELSRPFGEWVLLSALFVKLLQGRLVHAVAMRGPVSSAHGHFFTSVAQLLAHTAGQTEHPLAAVAAGIGRVLARASPGGVIQRLPAGQAVCFDPRSLHPHHQAMLAMAQTLLGNPDLGGDHHLAKWAAQAAQLAEELAAQMTDPVLAQAMGLSDEVFKAWASHAENAKKPSRQGSLSTDDSHARLLLARLNRLFRYYEFMAGHGLPAYASAHARLAGIGLPTLPPLPRSRAFTATLSKSHS